MKVAYALYELSARCPLNAVSSQSRRQGALLRFSFEEEKVGYADCHPWPELGDLPLDQQLKLLAQGQWTPLTECARQFAELDAEARQKGCSLLGHHSLPLSHFLVPDLLSWSQQDMQQAIAQGYTHLKLKVGRHFDLEIEKIHALFAQGPLKLRLDFNETLTAPAFHEFLHHMQQLKKWIDFIEDPFPFHPRAWEAIQDEGWRLACDRQVQRGCLYPKAADLLIIKPAIQSMEWWKAWVHRPCLVTSYLGHPVGQLAAAYVASQVDPFGRFVHGLLSHYAYHPTPFSEQLSRQGPAFKIPPGEGIGFKKELEVLKWIKLASL